MHLTAIAPYPLFPANSGGRRAISLLYQHLSKEVELTLLCTTDTQPPAGYDVHIKKVLGSSIFRYINPMLFFRVKKIMRENQSKHLVIDHPYMAWVGVALKWFTGIQFILRSHNIESLRFRSIGKWWWGLLWHYEKWMHRCADQGWFITEEDRNFAIDKFKLNPKCTTVISFGTEMKSAPDKNSNLVARKKLESIHGISSEEKILLFAGVLDYYPNIKAVENILLYILPRLLDKSYRFKILICGKGLPESIKSLPEFNNEHIIYAGFVDDIESYFMGADIFLNPVLEGGGIKSKLIEALGFGLTAVSTKSGANGVSSLATGNQLQIAEDEDWEVFVEKIIQAKEFVNSTNEFYKYYNWSNIANKAAKALTEPDKA